MDIKAKIEELIAKVKGDEALQSKFLADPVATVKELVGVDIPDEQLNAIVDGVKAKVTVEKAGGILGKLFGKK